MVTSELLPAIVHRLNIYKNHLLLAAEMGMPTTQFNAFRKYLLDQLGRNGFEQDLEEVLKRCNDRTGMGRTIHAGKEVQK
jgi:hypothetical protein